MTAFAVALSFIVGEWRMLQQKHGKMTRNLELEIAKNYYIQLKRFVLLFRSIKMKPTKKISEHENLLKATTTKTECDKLCAVKIVSSPTSEFSFSL